jgi:tetratricopeptide (TPR) repeat protein
MPKKFEKATRVRGDVGKLTQIEKVEGDVIIEPSKYDPSTLLQRGIQLIQVRAYEQAINVLAEAVKKDPLLADAHYYLALASLEGKRPKVLTLSKVEEIERYLRSAYEVDNSKAHYLYLWALVKYDFYVANGFLVRPPTVKDLLLAAQQCSYKTASILEMLEHVSGVDERLIRVVLRRS